MSTALHHVPRGLILGLLAALFASPAAPAFAQDDLLDGVARKKAVEAQKLEAELTKALNEVRQLERANPAQARGILLTYKDIVENDDTLSREARQGWQRQIEQKLAQIDRALDYQSRAAKTPTPPAPEPDLRSKYLQANPGATTRPGPGPTDVAGKYITGARDSLNTAEAIRQRRENGFASAMRDVVALDIPENGFVGFPKNWRQITESRKEFSGFQLSPEEAHILKALNSVMSVDFDRAPFGQVIDYIQETAKISVLPNKQAMEQFGIDDSTPVTLKAKKLSVRTVLKKVLGDVGLSYIIRDGVIQVVTPQEALETMTVRSYPVGDLVPPGDPRFGPFFNIYRERYYASQLINMIITTVEPASWAVNGGRGTIYYNEASRSIVISNSAELHLSLGSSFGR